MLGAYNLGPLSAHLRNAIQMAFRLRTERRPLAYATWVRSMEPTAISKPRSIMDDKRFDKCIGVLNGLRSNFANLIL